MLRLAGLCKSWGGQTVLRDLSLSLEPGTITWVGGRNGAGKTTMLRVAAGMIDAERGTVAALGIEPHRHRSHYQRLVSFLPAGDRGLYARLTVRRHLEFCAHIALLGDGQVRRPVEGALRTFDLAGLSSKRVDRLSMGQRQRLRLAITMLAEPRVLLLDEPLTSLDADAAGLLINAIAGLQDSGGAVLWCSPTGEQPDVRLHRVFTLHDGALVEG